MCFCTKYLKKRLIDGCFENFRPIVNFRLIDSRNPSRCAYVSPSPLAHTACRSKSLLCSVRNIAACFPGLLGGTCTASTPLSVQMFCRQQRRGPPRGLRPGRVHRRGRGVESPSLRRVIGCIEERAILGPGPYDLACLRGRGVRLSAKPAAPSVPREVQASWRVQLCR